MIAEKLRVFILLLYKNFLVRIRRWKMGLFVEIMIPILLFVTIWSIRNLVAKPPMSEPSKINSIDPKRDEYSSRSQYQLYIVPENPFVQMLMDNVKECLNNSDIEVTNITGFKTETELLSAVKTRRKFYYNRMFSALIFEDKNINYSKTHLKYIIQTISGIPQPLNSKIVPRYKQGWNPYLTDLQRCVDESFIHIKTNKSYFDIRTQQMPIPAHVQFDTADEVFRLIFCGFALLAFLIPLCIETSYASDERFLGINVLMAMNGVPNYLNLVSWLVSGLIFSIFYTIPVMILLQLTSSENALPYLYYGNPFIFWFILTIHVAHLIAFGIHISTYFRRSLFMITGILVIYIGTSAIQKFGVKENFYPYIPYLGIFFPNILLFRFFEEVNYKEGMMEGIRFHNLFRVGDSAYGFQGSVGIILIFSILGTILHIILGNYVYAINPGKYGAKKSPFYFLKFLKKFKKPQNYNEIENLASYNANGNLFEPVADGVYKPGIQIRNLKKSYSTSLFSKEKVDALRGVSIDFYQKQITTLLGHNGAGKTTMMSILTGMISPSEGLVLINGKSIKDFSDEIINDIGLCPQENIFFQTLSVAQQLRFFAMLKNKNKTKSEINTDVKRLLENLKLFEKRNTLPNELSGGQKRRLCLGMALISDPSILILDEPTSGLDPESKRNIWDILLKIRGEKTILISTHDMEEADILGDRIAIIHSGNLRSYGTSLFLKKLLGRGNVEVTLSTEAWCDPEKIRNHLDPQSEILNADVGKVELSIPYTPELPDSLDKIESNKKILGITGMSVSLITLEQVFLKVTKDDDDNDQRELFIDTTEKLKGRERLRHIAIALLRKKLTYTKKNIATLLTMLTLLVISLICISLMLMDHSVSKDHPIPVPLSLNMYYKPRTYYRTDSATKDFGHSYKLVTEEFSGRPSENLNEYFTITEGLLNVGSKDIANYKYHSIAAADFSGNSSHVNATALYYTNTAVFSKSISINLLTNALLKTLAGPDHSISISVQEFPRLNENDFLEQTVQEHVARYVVPLLIVFLLYPMVALFVVHPIRETSTNIKHLQRMTGVSSYNYWGTMFTFDFIVFISLTLIYIIGLLIINATLSLQMFGSVEFILLILLFALFAINFLPLIYCFSFWSKGTSAALKLLSLLPLGLVAVELTMSTLTESFDGRFSTFNKIRPIQRGIFLSIPYISFYHGIIKFFEIAQINGVCRQTSSAFSTRKPSDVHIFHCKILNCHNGTCENPLPYFDGLSGDVSLGNSILVLCLTPILYFGILSILEFKLFPKLIARIRGGKQKFGDEDFEEQVKKMKHNIAFEISKIKSRRDNKNNKKAVNGKVENIEIGTEEILPDDNEDKKHAFLVYELRKMYGNLMAVKDVSFGVHQRECFGLLGVNGAGKSTTFRMMTGEDIPNNGMMFLGLKDIQKNRDYYLSQMGYCPQNDAIIRCLNAYDHLRLFARLRGVPEDLVENEVIKWINRLNLNVCASKPSGTYSGGNKRRLNIAMALIGIPNLVLMDEPTTGIDPAARRSLWNVIQLCQASGQAVILTSHSMEECEALCTRLAIMVDGKLQCIGACQELKQRFGAGYNIQLKLNPEISETEIPSIKKDIEKSLNGDLMDENSGCLMYHLTSTELTWRQMYDVMTKLKNKYSCIEDFSVLSATLEQLFLMFARNADKNRNPK